MKLVHGDALQFDPRLLRLSFQQFEATGGEASQANEILAKEENNILDEGCGNKRKLQIIANLPFNISTVLCTRWLKWMSHHHSMPLTEEGDEDRTTIPWDNFMSERPVEMLLIFQKEVAERLVAIPKTKEMSRLTVLAQYVCQTKLVYDLPSKVFVPSPDVT